MSRFDVDFLKSRLKPEDVARIERKDDALVKAWREDAEKHFHSFAPRIDFGKLKTTGAPCPEAFEAVRSWASDETPSDGVYLFGKTGTGKTCAAVAVIWNQVYFPERRGRVFADLLEAEVLRTEFPVSRGRFNGDAFQLWAASDLRDKFNDVCRSMEDKTELFGKLNAADYLLIDDLGHTLSPSFAENLRLVLERTEAIIVITSQFSPTKLIERWSGKAAREDMTELVEAIARRIRARCVGIEFLPAAATQPGKA